MLTPFEVRDLLSTHGTPQGGVVTFVNVLVNMLNVLVSMFVRKFPQNPQESANSRKFPQKDRNFRKIAQNNYIYKCYHTSQSLELSFLIAEMLKQQRPARQLAQAVEAAQ